MLKNISFDDDKQLTKAVYEIFKTNINEYPQSVQALSGLNSVDDDVLRLVINRIKYSVNPSFAYFDDYIKIIEKNSPHSDLIFGEIEGCVPQNYNCMVMLDALDSTAVPVIVDYLEKYTVSTDKITSLIRFIGKKKSKAGVALLMKNANANSKEIKQTAIQALGDLGENAAPAVPMLINMLGQNDVRMVIIYSLGKIGPSAKEAIPKLQELYEKSDLITQNALREAITKIQN